MDDEQMNNELFHKAFLYLNSFESFRPTAPSENNNKKNKYEVYI